MTPEERALIEALQLARVKQGAARDAEDLTRDALDLFIDRETTLD